MQLELYNPPYVVDAHGDAAFGVSLYHPRNQAGPSPGFLAEPALMSTEETPPAETSPPGPRVALNVPGDRSVLNNPLVWMGASLVAGKTLGLGWGAAAMAAGLLLTKRLSTK